MAIPEASTYQVATNASLNAALTNYCNQGVGNMLWKELDGLNPITTDQGWWNLPYTAIASVGSVLQVAYKVIALPFKVVHYFVRSETPEEKACQTLLEQGANVLNSTDIYGRGVLAQAASRGTGALEVFAQAGANGNMRAFDGTTVLHEVAKVGDPESVDVLLTHARAVNVNASDANDTTPLHVAALSSNVPVFAALLKARANPKAVDRWGRTVLMVSAKHSSECFDLLSRLDGIEFLGRDKKHAGVWHYAAANPNGRAVMQILHSRGVSSNQLDLNLETPLHYAARFGIEEVVSDLVYYGLNPDALSKEGLAPIHLAVEGNMSDMIYKLAAVGANVNLVNPDQESPLHQAAKRGFVDSVKALVANGADLNQVDSFGRTPLALAILNGQEDVAAQLMALGASFELTPYNGHSPLYSALKLGLNSVADLLEKNGAKAKAGKNSELALHEAVAQDNMREVDNLVLSGYKLSQRDRDFQTALMIALMRGNLPIAQKLIQYANLSQHPDLALVLDRDNRMAIHYAVMNGDVNIIGQLLRVMKQPIPKDVYGRSCLHYAAERGSLPVVIELSKQTHIVGGLDQEDADGYTPLDLALLEGQLDVAMHLIDCGASVERINGNGQASIHLAAQLGNLDLVKLLLSRSPILLNWKDNEGKTPLAYCNEGSDLERYLIAQGGKILVDGYDPIQLAIMYNNPSALPSDNQKLFHSRRPNGDTNLHLAINVQASDSAKELVSRADAHLLNYPNGDGDTPLILAARKGETKTLVALLEKGADVRSANKDGLTALHYAVMRGDVEVIKAILLKHPNLNSYSKDGLTPLGTAIAAKQDAAARLLGEVGAVSAVQSHVYSQEDSIPFLNLIHLDNFKKVQDFLLAGVTDVSDNKGRSAIHYAVSPGVSKEMLLALLGAGFNPNLVDHFGRTPLMWAVQNGNNEALKILLDVNAHISKQELEKMRSYAEKMNLKKIVDLIQGALNKGVK